MIHRRTALGRRVRLVLHNGQVVVGRFLEAKTGRVRVEGAGWLDLASIRTLTYAKNRVPG